MILTKRYATSHLKSLIRSYLDIEKSKNEPKHLAYKKAFKQKSTKEALQDIVFYTKFCLKETANQDKEFILLVKKVQEICKSKNTKAFEIILKEF